MHHGIPQNLPMPTGVMLPHNLLSHIIDLMSRSMGEQKRKTLIEDLEEYKLGLPFDLR